MKTYATFTANAQKNSISLVRLLYSDGMAGERRADGWATGRPEVQYPDIHQPGVALQLPRQRLPRDCP